MLFNRDKNKSIFDKINEYLLKKGHELVMSIYLSNYNNNNIYIRFDYIKKLSVYKIVWVDLNFFDEKHIEDYINIQMVTKYLSMKIVEKMIAVEYDNSYSFDEDIIGDRVEILSYFKEEPREYIFDRFLPLEWKQLIDPLAMIFAYLPRSMEVFLNEIFGKFDGTEEKFNYTKPVRFDLFEGDAIKLFRPISLEAGTKLYDNGKVTFLEKVNNKYLAIVEDRGSNLVVLDPVSEGYVIMWCNCKANYYCKHTYAALLALRKKEFKSFYKVKYIGREETLLEKVTLGSYYLCYGIDGDNILLVTEDGTIFPAEVVQKGKCVFEVIEDDDDCSLSKLLKDYKVKNK